MIDSEVFYKERVEVLKVVFRSVKKKIYIYIEFCKSIYLLYRSERIYVLNFYGKIYRMIE